MQELWPPRLTAEMIPSNGKPRLKLAIGTTGRFGSKAALQSVTSPMSAFGCTAVARKIPIRANSTEFYGTEMHLWDK